MALEIAHRGPDDRGFLLATQGAGANRSEPIVAAHTGSSRDETTELVDAQIGDAVVGLAHLRLSIIDLSERGHQPMRRAGATAWIVHNGEAYNFRELRNQLEAEGFRFFSGTDTEVLLAAYERWGENFVNRCAGMFAFAIFDPVSRRLILYRDRIGIKPLYLHLNSRGVTFASEIKALVANDEIPRRVDADAVAAFLAFQTVNHRPETFFAGISEVPPGHYVRIDLDKRDVKIIRYYDLSTAVADRIDGLPEDDESLVELVRHEVFDVVRSHLVSDVRVGTCLSGGIDSSSIVCVTNELMRQNRADGAALAGRITTFTSCHLNPRFDEQEYADAAIDACTNSVEPIKVFPGSDDLAAALDTLVWHQDEPFTSPSIYAQYCLMEAARRQGVTVLLDGQGGDEIFCGYRKFFFFYLKDLLRSGRWSTAASEIAGGLLRGDADLFDFTASRRYLPSAVRGQTRTIANYLRDQSQWAIGLAEYGSGTDIQTRQILDVERYSLPALLRYEDRNSMAFGIEARVPFLDHRLIETGIALPSRIKIRNGVSKVVLRRAMQGLVPDKILSRRTKMGFGTPEAAWIRHGLRPAIEAMLAKPSSLISEHIYIAEVERCFRQFIETGRSALAPREFFRLLCLDRWARLFKVEAN